MADEVSIGYNMRLIKGNMNENISRAFQADMVTDDPKGPYPGSIAVATAGTVVSLSELTTPCWCEIVNLDDTNFVEWGIKEPSSGFFYPIGELGPGEGQIHKFSRNLLEEYTGAGTGTSAATNQLFFKADTAACIVVIKAFER